MLRKAKLKSNLYLFIGMIFIVAGLFIGFSEYFQSKKQKAFSKMSIMLYESETPQNIVDDSSSTVVDNDDDDDENTGDQDEQVPDKPKQVKPTSRKYIGILEIPKISLKQGFYDLDSAYNNVDMNITVIRGSTFPEIENNNLILAAHSGNCWQCYFNKLYKLNVGDEAYLTYKGNVYNYKIVNIYEVEKTGSVTIYRDYDKSVLTLITCTRNSDTKQTVYILELQN